jgi:uncharacterized membrane protein
MVVFGKIFSKKSPKEINMLFGYRTSMSMKNKDTWDFAHKYCGKLWYLMGIIMLPLSVVVMVFCLNDEKNKIGIYSIIILIVQTIVMIFSIVMTERELNKIFYKDGNRKNKN